MNTRPELPSFPAFSGLATKYLGIAASLLLTERMFSKAWEVVRRKQQTCKHAVVSEQKPLNKRKREKITKSNQVKISVNQNNVLVDNFEKRLKQEFKKAWCHSECYWRMLFHFREKCSCFEVAGL